MEVAIDHEESNYRGVTRRKARAEWLYENIFINVFHQK